MLSLTISSVLLTTLTVRTSRPSPPPHGTPPEPRRRWVRQQRPILLQHQPAKPPPRLQPLLTTAHSTSSPRWRPPSKQTPPANPQHKWRKNRIILSTFSIRKSSCWRQSRVNVVHL